jgi:MFS family permease
MLKKYFEPGALFSFVAYRNLWISTFITTVAMSAFPIALAVTVLDAGGGATTLGLIMGVRVLAGVLLSPVGGVWADRLPRKTVLIVADGSRAIMGSIVVFFDPTTISLWILGCIVVLMGVSDAFGGPASQAIIPSLLPDRLLPAGNVARGIAVRTATIAGPGIAGVIVVSLGTHATYLATSIFFLIGTVVLFKINEGPLKAAEGEPNKFFHDLKDGLRVVWMYKWIAAMIIMASFQLMMVVATENVMLPVITKREFGTASVFATAAALFSLGGAISALISIRLKTKRPGLISITVWGLFIFAPLVLAIPSSRELIFLAYFVAGFSVGPWEAFWSTQVQREVPAVYQGRVFSIDYMGTVGLLPLGMALAGPMTSWLGEKPFLIGVSIFHLLICAVTLLVPGAIEMKAPPKKDSSIGEQEKG